MEEIVVDFFVLKQDLKYSGVQKLISEMLKGRTAFCTAANNLALQQKVKEYLTGLPAVTKNVGLLMKNKEEDRLLSVVQWNNKVNRTDFHFRDFIIAIIIII